MSTPLPTLIYFFGPLALAILVRRLFGIGWKVLGAGFVTFLVAWTGVMVLTQMVALLSPAFAEGTFLLTILVAGAAGLFEETARYIAFRTFRGLRSAPTWRTGVTFAVGHSGAEAFIVGGSLLLTAAVVLRAPESLSPDLLAASQELLATGTLAATYAAVERVLVGFLMHAAFTLVVLLAVIRSDLRYLALAVAWHMVHDIVAQNLPRLSEHWTAHAAWIGFILVAYTWILVRLIRVIGWSGRPNQAVAAAATTVDGAT